MPDIQTYRPGVTQSSIVAYGSFTAMTIVCNSPVVSALGMWTRRPRIESRVAPPLKIVKISQYSVKIWTRILAACTFVPPCIVTCFCHSCCTSSYISCEFIQTQFVLSIYGICFILQQDDVVSQHAAHAAGFLTLICHGIVPRRRAQFTRTMLTRGTLRLFEIFSGMQRLQSRSCCGRRSEL